MTDTQSTDAVKSQQIYRLYDSANVLLYIGISKSALVRLTQHLDSQPWADEVANVKVEHHDVSRRQIESMERAAIIAERPRHNVVHNGQTRSLDTVTGWRCETCRRDAYYVQTDWDEQWHAVCKAHDVLGDNARYWFTTERTATLERTQQWEEHLHHKNWFDLSSWRRMVNKCAPKTIAKGLR